MEFLIQATLLTLILLALLYVGIFGIYYFLIAFSSRKRRQFVRNGRYNLAEYCSNMFIIIYAHNDEKTVVPLLESLNKQNYPKENYKTFIILDNCTDNSSKILEMVGGADIFRVGEACPLGKDESVSQLLDRLIAYKNVNAYVFLNANRNVDENFLNSINQSLVKQDVLVGSTVLKGEPSTLKDKILDAFNKYENIIINTSRTMLGLSSVINADCCVIKQNVIEKVQCIDFKDINSELKYSVMLSKLNFKTAYNPNIVTYLDRENYKVRKPSFSYRINLFKNSLPILFNSGFLFCEFILSTIQPSVLFLTAFLAFFSWLIINFSFGMPFSIFFNSKVLIGLIVLLVGSAIYSISKSTLTIKEMGYLLLYPLYSTGQLLRKTLIIKQIFDIVDNVKHPKQYEKHMFPVIVSAGNKKMNCNIELIKEDGMVRAVFIFKRKKQATDLYLRAFDAIKSISDLLAQKEYEIVDPATKQVVEKGNFDLQICQNCKYFTSTIDGSINIVKGLCTNCKDQNSAGNSVMLWQHCENYAPNKEKIIDIGQYRK